ncbi:unnamed protein product [marine sediment metagenome]|uniref:Uncharacterized protein n=1 Tax=marine sediment metagenome TaxID=412755 RepID=X1LCA5_9ZZZZ
MPDINKPMDIPELNLQPPITGKVKLSPDMQQTLALLCGLGNSQRIALRASVEGVLLIGEPVLKDVVILTGVLSGDPELSYAHGNNIPCSSVLIMAWPTNTDTVWVRPYAKPALNHGWPLYANDVIRFAVANLNHLHFLFDTNGERVIIAYTR